MSSQIGLYTHPRTGNVGIGTTAPRTKLNLTSSGVASDATVLTMGGGGTQCSLGIDFTPDASRSGGAAAKIRAVGDVSGNAGLSLWTATGGSATAAVERVRVLADGNVGIGTTQPQYNLDVSNGTIRTNTLLFGQLYAGSGNATLWNYGASGDWYIRSVSNNGRVIIQDTIGNVGIGTPFPGEKLDIIGNIKLLGKAILGNDIWHTSIDNVYRFYFSTAGTTFFGTGNGEYRWRNNLSQDIMILGGTGSANFAGSIQAATYLEAVGGQTTGGVFFTGDIPTARWQIAILGAYRLGFLRYTGSSYVTQSYIDSGGNYTGGLSDYTLKEHIEPLNIINSFNKIISAIPVHFQYKDRPDDKINIGLIAQDLLNSNPYAVNEVQYTQSETKLSINYQDYTIHLIGAIQHQQKIIDKLESKLLSLENRISILENK